MAPPLATIDASEPLDKILDAITRDGGVIVSNFLDPILLKESMDAIQPFLSRRSLYDSKSTHEEFGAEFFPEGSQRVYGLLSKMPDQLIKILRLPVWRGIMAHFLDGEFNAYTGEKLVHKKSGYILSSTAAIRLVPGAESQPLHRDDVNYPTHHDPSDPLFTPMVGCLIAGSKCTYKNGATHVIPKSHLWGLDRAPKAEECTFAEMEAGSALFTLGTTYHGAGENQCEKTDPDALRTLFAVFGQRDYYRQDQEEVLSTPIEVARRLPDDILKLAGYYKAVGGVGYVEDHQSPVEMLQMVDSGMGKFCATTTEV